MRHLFVVVLGSILLIAGCTKASNSTTIEQIPAKASAHTQDNSGFDAWAAKFQADARAEGIDAGLLSQAFNGMEPIDQVIELDRKQPEGTMTMEQYLQKVVPQSRIDRARAAHAENRGLLEEVSKKYGVQSSAIVALWAVESNFGERMGDYSIVNALATLAYDGRRSEYFRKELMNAFKIIQQGNVSLDNMTGSWAGAMGQCQFMPSSYLRYAVDYNGDGRKDIWDTRADVFASIANYLSNEGWDNSRSVEANKNVLLKWNRSSYFAAAVSKIAAAIES